MSAILEAKELIKNYGNLAVLRNISLSINNHEIVSIVGASGAGKTTLLQILSTLDRADSGQVNFKNKDLSKLKTKEIEKIRNQHFGFIFQFHNLLPELSALENVCLPGWIGKKNKAEVEESAKELLEILKVANRMDNHPGQLSGGEAQRVAVARALINQPDIIFADEPSGNLDTENARNLHQLFFELRDTFDQTFVIVTHNKELAEMSDRTITLKDGQLA